MYVSVKKNTHIHTVTQTHTFFSFRGFSVAILSALRAFSDSFFLDETETWFLFTLLPFNLPFWTTLTWKIISTILVVQLF